MPNPPVFTPQYLYDFLKSVDKGMNAGIDPLLIPRNQAAYLRNATVRGTFVTHRPSFSKIALDFGGNGDLQVAATQNLWQDGCYFKSDDGIESLMAIVAGRLFRFVINGQAATVTERTTTGLQQLTSVAQCWMWQSERWVIVNDGFNLPLFDDGVIIRRSVGNSQTQAGTTSGFTRVSGNVTIPLNGPFTGPIPSTVLILGKKYLINSVTPAAGSAFSLTLKHLYGTDTTIASGLDLISASPYEGYLTQAITSSYGQTISIIVDAPFTGRVNDYVGIQTKQAGTTSNDQFRVLSISADKLTLQITTIYQSERNAIAAAGTAVRIVRTGGFVPTNVTTTYSKVGTLAAGFSSPAIGATVVAKLTSAFTAALGTVVQLGAGVHYQVIDYSVDPTQIYNAAATNVNDVATGTVAAATPLLLNATELPAGKMGAYGLGRNWQALIDGKSFVASDIVNGASGTQAYNFRDAVLSMTENDLLVTGGTFVVPGQVGDIRAMIFTAILDASLGQGPVAVLTPDIVFSCQAPLDRSTWQTITNPILTESLKANGGQGQNSTINFNSDLLYRSYDGFRSLILARRDFDTWGNVPISREVEPIISNDDPALLSFGSTIDFDNRALFTANPQQSGIGVYHNKIIALNADPLSSLQGKAPSVYDGVWDGLNVLKLVTGSFFGVKRAFAFCLSQDLTTIELWEIKRSQDTAIDDDGQRITWEFESASLNFYENDPRKRNFLRLLNGEIRVDGMGITGIGQFGAPITEPHEVSFSIFYRVDQHPTWVPWHSWTETFNPNDDPGFRPTMGLGEPDAKVFDETNNRPMREGTTFQIKVQVTGHCRLLSARLLGCTIPAPDFTKPA